MKKILKISSIAFLLIMGTACENDNQTIASAKGGPELIAPASGTEYTLSPLNAATTEASTLIWNHADYDVQTEVNYEVQFATAGTNFATIVSGGTTTSRFMTYTVEALNAIALQAGLTPYTAGDLDVRIRGTLGSNAALESFSNVITLRITSYTNDLPKLYVVGNFLTASGYGSDWTPASAVPLASSGFGQTDYEGYVYFNQASFEYKFLPTNTSFDGDYGDDGSFSGGLIETGESNALGTGAGYYRVKADTAALTYSIDPAEWSVTGNATALGWPAGEGVPGQDYDMTYNQTTKKWSIILPLTGGLKIKFRANDRWTLNYGSTAADGSTLNEGGSDIDVPATGTYLIELDLSNPRDYKYSLTAQ